MGSDLGAPHPAPGRRDADAELFYANVVRDDLEARIREPESSVDLVVFDPSSPPIVDLAAAEILGDLRTDLESQGIDLGVAGANDEVTKTLEATDEEGKLGEIRVREEETIASVVERWRREQEKD